MTCIWLSFDYVQIKTLFLFMVKLKPWAVKWNALNVLINKFYQNRLLIIIISFHVDKITYVCCCHILFVFLQHMAFICDVLCYSPTTIITTTITGHSPNWVFFLNELFRRYFQNVLCLKVLYIGACAITSFNSLIFKISVGKLCNIFNHTIVASLNWCTVFNKTVF